MKHLIIMKYILKNKFFQFGLALTALAFMFFTIQPDLPGEINTYLKKHFENQEVIKYKTEWEFTGTKHKVYLNDGTKLKFDKRLQIYKAENKRGLPAEILPENIRLYLVQNYADVGFKEWKVKAHKNKQEVELLNDIELEFDLNGNFLRID